MRMSFWILSQLDNLCANDCNDSMLKITIHRSCTHVCSCMPEFIEAKTRSDLSLVNFLLWSTLHRPESGIKEVPVWNLVPSPPRFSPFFSLLPSPYSISPSFYGVCGSALSPGGEVGSGRSPAEKRFCWCILSLKSCDSAIAYVFR